MDFTLQVITDKIKRDKGLDLSGYKETTLQRRIERRMQFDGASSLEEYIRMLDKDYRLYWRLVSDFFIGVTDFFRDKEIWDIVQGEVLPEIVRSRESPNLPIRIWSAGCSTGEETYSLAIAAKEALRTTNRQPLVFVHGTDIMDDKLEIAKRGLYSHGKIEKVEKSLREKYFVLRTPNSELQATIKYMTRFKTLDLAHPKDYAGFDMIVCRNVLIYFQRELQERVIKYFHKALRPNGILWLGKSETLWGESEMLFKPIYKNEKIFKRYST